MGMANKTVDAIIIGSGIAGLMTAHLLADHMNVMIITKSNVNTSNSSCAQGGMAAALGPDDDWRKHLADTLKAGGDHHNETHVEMLVKRAPAIVSLLDQLGVPFDKDEDGALVLGMEGAHQNRRIVHVNGDKTGQAFTEALINAVKERVEILDYTMVKKLVSKNGRVIGVHTEKECIYAKATVLATGGLGGLYEHTSNVEEATADGFALAYRAGATLIDMEFIQFHPTLLRVGGETMGLISEAVRGEGAKLIDKNGKRLMEDFPLKELESRDVVSREIHKALQNGNEIYLDCRGIKGFKHSFPGLSERCEKALIDPTVTPLAVVPGAHFVSGGIETDSSGRTSLKGLYAVGEVACTGVHGANRLASNSLLEGLVFAEQVASDIQSVQSKFQLVYSEEDSDITVPHHLPFKSDIQIRMTKFVGIERDLSGLLEMKSWLEQFLPYANQILSTDSHDTIECKNMLIVSALITEAAIHRTESRGGHYRLDFPKRNDHLWSSTYVALSKEKGAQITQKEKRHLVLENI
jgi:L-aspartate oxidase